MKVKHNICRLLLRGSDSGAFVSPKRYGDRGGLFISTDRFAQAGDPDQDSEGNMNGIREIAREK